MSVRYSEDFKKEVVKAYMAGNKSTVQIAADYNIAKSTVSQWVNQYREECLYTTNSTTETNEAREIRRLNQLLNEKDKEIADLQEKLEGAEKARAEGISLLRWHDPSSPPV